jgi:hypothetical protein
LKARSLAGALERHTRINSVKAFSLRAFGSVAAALGGFLVIGVHFAVGLLDSGRLRLRPVGEASGFLVPAWILCALLCLPALIISRGRSRIALVALGVTMLSFALALTV